MMLGQSGLSLEGLHEVSRMFVKCSPWYERRETKFMEYG
jgi:hypothetical protein